MADPETALAGHYLSLEDWRLTIFGPLESETQQTMLAGSIGSGPNEKSFQWDVGRTESPGLPRIVLGALVP